MASTLPRKRLRFAGLGGLVLALAGAAASVGFHGGLALAVLSLPKDQKREATAIAIQEAKKKPPKPAEPARLEEPAPKEKTQTRKPSTHAKSAPAEAKSEARPTPNAGHATALEGLPDFGLSFSGGGGPGGLALPGGGAVTAAEGASTASSKKPQPIAARRDDECPDPVVRPKPIRQIQPVYNDSARGDRIEGRVRVETQVDARGKVSSARVLAGLGHGLDEAAIAAVKQWTFEPASRCGAAVAHTIVVPFTFKIAQ